jgi:23S rRNA (adenine-N6)-dimethyltransferase
VEPRGPSSGCTQCPRRAPPRARTELPVDERAIAAVVGSLHPPPGAIAADSMTGGVPAEPHYVLSSAPYNIGTRLVRRLLTEAHGIVQAALVLQLETARRIARRPRSGRFAATWAPWFELRVGRRIPATAFRPVPSVDSAVLTLTPRTVPLLSPVAFRACERFLAQAFGRGGGRLFPRGTAPSRLPPEAYAELFLTTRVT